MIMKSARADFFARLMTTGSMALSSSSDCSIRRQSASAWVDGFRLPLAMVRNSFCWLHHDRRRLTVIEA
jgi:hypothetical protein